MYSKLFQHELVSELFSQSYPDTLRPAQRRRVGASCLTSEVVSDVSCWTDVVAALLPVVWTQLDEIVLEMLRSGPICSMVTAATLI